MFRVLSVLRILSVLSVLRVLCVLLRVLWGVLRMCVRLRTWNRVVGWMPGVRVLIRHHVVVRWCGRVLRRGSSNPRFSTRRRWAATVAPCADPATEVRQL